MNRRSFLSIVKGGLLAAGATAVLASPPFSATANAAVDIDVVFNHWRRRHRRRWHHWRHRRRR